MRLVASKPGTSHLPRDTVNNSEPHSNSFFLHGPRRQFVTRPLDLAHLFCSDLTSAQCRASSSLSTRSTTAQEHGAASAT